MVGNIPHAIYVATIAYALVGLVVAIAFLLFALDRLNPAAQGSVAFRPLLVPGLALLWPYVLLRWRRGPRAAILAPQRRQRAAHARVWYILAAILPLILLGGLVLRQGGPLEAPAVQLAAPMP